MAGAAQERRKFYAFLDCARTSIVKNRKLILLAIIVLYALVYSLVFFIGPSNFSDDYAYTQMAYYTYKLNFFESQYDVSLRMLTFAPIALFYGLFGVTPLSSSAWSILAYLMTLMITYRIGKELHSENAGLLGAALLTFFPLINKYATTVNDDTIYMFFTSLAFLAILLAERKNSKMWYAVAGVTLVAIPVVGPLGLLIVAAIALYLIIELVRSRIKVDEVSIHFLYGVLCAGVILMLVNFCLSGDPLITLTGNLSSSAQPAQVNGYNADLGFYLIVMFPYNYIPPALSPVPVSNVLQSALYLISTTTNSVGFYYYIFVLCALYIVVRKQESAYFLLFWFFAMLLLFEFGPASISLNPFTYVFTNRLDRYLLTMAVPLVLTISIATLELVGAGKTVQMRYIGMGLAVVIILFLVLTSIDPSTFWYYIFSYGRYDLLAISSKLSTLPNSTLIYSYSGFPVDLYMGYSNEIRFTGYGPFVNCTDFSPGSYVIAPNIRGVVIFNSSTNSSLRCPSWTLVLSPVNNESYPPSITTADPYMQASLYYVKPH